MIKWHKLGLKEEKNEFGAGESNVLTIRGGPNQIEMIESQLGPLNRWVVCTDFDISTDQLQRLNDMAGIESVDPISCYRLRFIIGDAFNENVVKDEANEILRHSIVKRHRKAFMTAEYEEILSNLSEKWGLIEHEGRPTYFFGSAQDDEWAEHLMTVLKHAANDLNTEVINN